MEKPINVQIYETRETIKEVIAQSGLNISIVELIIDEIRNEVKSLANDHLNRSIAKLREENQDNANKEEVTENGGHISVPESDS